MALLLYIRRLVLLGVGLAALSLALALLLLLVLAGEIYEYSDTVDGVHLPQVNAIVCLAGGRGRIAAAGDLWVRYLKETQGTSPPVLYISGMGPHSTFGVFARQLRSGVRELVKPENVVLEIESTNTEANAQWLARYAAQKGWNDIVLVTSSYHMKRANFIFNRVLSRSEHPVRVHTLSVFQEPFEPAEWRGSLHGVEVTLMEYVKAVFYKTLWKPL